MFLYEGHSAFMVSVCLGKLNVFRFYFYFYLHYLKDN